jgi:hypothetical protein
MIINISIALLGLYLTCSNTNLLELIPTINISTQGAKIRALVRKKKISVYRFGQMEDFPDDDDDDDNNVINRDVNDVNFLDNEEAGQRENDIYYDSDIYYEDDENFVQSRRFRSRL